MKTHEIPWNQSLSLPFTGPVHPGWPLLAAAIGLSRALLHPSDHEGMELDLGCR